MNNEAFKVLKRSIEEIQVQQGYPSIEVRLDCHLVNDLGLTSLDIAQLVAMMEIEVGVDPFSSGATLDQIATVRDLSKLYST